MTKQIGSVLLVVALTLLAGWLVVGSWVPEHPLLNFLLVVFFAIPNVGALWMIYIAIRYEAKPFLFVGLAFIPFAFLWYYFCRYRDGRYRKRECSPGSS
jgi:hypothetical protein